MTATIDLGFLSSEEIAHLESFRRDWLEPGRAVVWLGAGVSRQEALPDGPGLAEALAAAGGLAVADPRDLVAVTTAYEERHSTSQLHLTLARLLADEGARLSAAHQLVARMPFHAYVTTNVDRLMEWALHEARRPVQPIVYQADTALLELGRVPVVKLHGTLEHPHTMVFSRNDFRRFAQRKPAFETLLCHLLATRRVLFIGFGCRDENFLKALRWTRTVGAPAPHLVIDLGREAERRGLLRRGLFLVDPDKRGTGAYHRLAAVLGALAGMDRRGLARVAAQRPHRANPFPGLAAYGPGTARFQGREAEVAALAGRLKDLRPVTVFFGPSGCGKSSLFQAGLLPHLQGRADVRAQVVRLTDTLLPERVLARALGEDELDAALQRERLAGRMAVLVIDQFEQLFYPPFPAEVRDRFLGETLPDLAARHGDALRLILVLRSDELHHLHRYRGRPHLKGVYVEAERLDPMDAATATRVLADTFAARDYVLAPACAARLVKAACSNGQAGGAVYLPYLQLLAHRFFDHLEERHGERRSEVRTTRVGVRDLGALFREGSPFARHLHDAVAELLALEHDRAAVLRLFELLVEGERRRLLRRDRLEAEFADPHAMGLLLFELANRRIVQFDETLGGYELVHDSLVQPLRDYIDRQRTDYSASEFAAALRRVLVSGRAAPELLANLLRYALRRGLAVDGIERALMPPGGWPAFYDRLRTAAWAEDRPGIWERLAETVSRAGGRPAGLTADELLRTVLAADDPRTARAAVRLLGLGALSDGEAQVLRAWADPDHADAAPLPEAWRVLLGSGLDRCPQRRGWPDVLDAALEVLFARPHADPLGFFGGYVAALYSEADWWEPYYRHLVVLADGRLPAQDVADRLRRDLDDGDPERTIALARVLIAADALPEPLVETVQHTLMGLGALRGRPGFALLPELAGRWVERAPKAVFVRLSAHISDLARGEDALAAFERLGIAAQDPDDLQDLALRFLEERDPEIKSLLFHAAAWCPADHKPTAAFDGLIAGHWREDLRLLQPLLRLHDPKTIRLCERLLDRDGGGSDLDRTLADLFEPLTIAAAPVLAWRLGERLPLRNVLWGHLLRLWQAQCRALAARVAGLPEAAAAGDLWPFPADGDPVALVRWFDAIIVATRSAGRSRSERVRELNAALRWLRVQLDACGEALRGDGRLLASRLAEWFTRFREPAVWAQARATPLHRCWLSREPVPDAIGLLLGRPGTLEALRETFVASGLPDPDDAAKARDALDALRRAEEEATLSHALLAVEEMLRVLADALAAHPVPGCEGFLWALLSRQERVGCPGRTEAARVDGIVSALVCAYDGHEDRLVDSVGTQFLDPETAFALLTAAERRRPGCARAALVARLEDVGADRAFEPQTIAALAALAGGPLDDALSDMLRRLVRDGAGTPVGAAAARALSWHAATVDDRLLLIGSGAAR